MRQTRSAIGATTIIPELSTSAARFQYEGYLRRINAVIPALAKDGASIKHIVRHAGHSIGSYGSRFRGERNDVPTPADETSSLAQARN